MAEVFVVVVVVVIVEVAFQALLGNEPRNPREQQATREEHSDGEARRENGSSGSGSGQNQRPKRLTRWRCGLTLSGLRLDGNGQGRVLKRRGLRTPHLLPGIEKNRRRG